jgi:hypothetical protein
MELASQSVSQSVSYVRTEGLAVVTIKGGYTLFQDVTPCSLVEVYRRFKSYILPPFSGLKQICCLFTRLTFRP